MDMDLIGVGIMVAIIILAAGISRYWIPYAVGQSSQRQGDGKRARGRISNEKQAPDTSQITAKSLETYERLAREKLEVIKTALAMGYNDDEIARLDARLEKLVGKNALEAILRGSGSEAMASADLLDTQLDHEIDRLRNMREHQ